MTIESMAQYFLKVHYNANEIVMDSQTGLPIKAIYNLSDSSGNYRTQPAIFWFNPENNQNL